MNKQVQTSEELSDLNSHELLLKLEEARDCARLAGHDWVKADKAFKDARELLPCVFAEYARHYSAAGAKSTDVKWKALSDKGYQEKVKEMNQLEYAANLLDVEYRGWMKTIDCLTSIAYVRNNELKLSRN